MSISSVKIQIRKTFIGRKKIISDIGLYLYHRDNKPSLLNIYGIGGVGKSSLRSALERKYTDSGSHSITLNLKNPEYRNCEAALNFFRRDLKKNKNYIFPAYDFARTVYWRKRNPDVTLESNPNLPFLEEGDLTANFINEVFSDAIEIPLLGLIPKGAQMICKYSGILRDWWNKRGIPLLEELDSLDYVDIEELLYDFWIEDFHNNFKKDNSENILIFIDSFEKLWEEEVKFYPNMNKDNWLRNLIKDLPQISFVSFGRNKIEEFVKNTPIELNEIQLYPFEDSEAILYLREFGIVDKNIQDKILYETKKIPFYLSLEIQSYKLNKDSKEQYCGVNSDNLDSVVKKFLYYLSSKENNFLKTISVPRKITQELSNQINDEFNLGLRLDEQMLVFSNIFFEKVEGNYFLHDLIREYFLKLFNDNREELTKIHEFLFNYYEKKIINYYEREVGLNIFKESLLEAIEFGKYIFKVQNYINWYSSFNESNSNILPFEFKLECANAFKKAIEEISEEPVYNALPLFQLGTIYCNSGKSKSAQGLPLLLEAERLYNKSESIECKKEYEILFRYNLKQNISMFYRSYYEEFDKDYSKSINYLSSCVEYLEKNRSGYFYNERFANDLFDLASLYSHTKNANELEKILEKINEIPCDDFTKYRKLGEFYLNNNSYLQAEKVLLKAVGVFEKKTDSHGSIIFDNDFDYELSRLFLEGISKLKTIEPSVFFDEAEPDVSFDEAEPLLGNLVEEKMYTAYCYNLLARISLDRYDLDSAMDYSLRSLKYNSDSDLYENFSYEIYMEAMSNIANIYMEKQDIENGKYAFEDLLNKQKLFYPPNHEEVCKTELNYLFASIYLIEDISSNYDLFEKYVHSFDKLIELKSEYVKGEPFLPLYLGIKNKLLK